MKEENLWLQHRICEARVQIVGKAEKQHEVITAQKYQPENMELKNQRYSNKRQLRHLNAILENTREPKIVVEYRRAGIQLEKLQEPAGYPEDKNMI